MTATSSSETASSAKSSSTGPVRRIGPGLITGAADDDPSGVATYSQAGAQAGFGLMWTLVLTWPLMVAVQSVSARIGRVTGRGLAFNMCRCFPRPVVFTARIIMSPAVLSDVSTVKFMLPMLGPF